MIPPVFILVRPQMGENIGAAARAMLNFGLDRMRIVAPRDGWPNPKANAMASGAGRVLDNAGLFPDVARSIALRPAGAAPSCAVAAGFVLWMRDSVAPAAQRHFRQRVIRVVHLGSYNCRPIAGGGGWSEHATANALDISAFILADGTRISLIADWNGDAARAAFLRDVRDGACELYSTVLSPDYNRAHADHFHFDMADRAGGWQVCR